MRRGGVYLDLMEPERNATYQIIAEQLSIRRGVIMYIKDMMSEIATANAFSVKKIIVGVFFLFFMLLFCSSALKTNQLVV